MTTYTPIDEIPKIREELAQGFASGRSRDIAYRKQQLLQLAYMLQDHRSDFETAVQSDLGRPPLETNFIELGPCINEALTAYKKVSSWAKPDGVPFNLNTFVMKPKVIKDPQGVVLIIGPFNYPLWCLIVPFVGAIAAGNAVLLKPSELASHTERLLVELIPQYLDQTLYRVVTAEIPGTTKILELQWDHIMYTGGATVGRIVASAASKHLTPVSLELGGKSPVIVDPSADLALTARRTLWAKSLNSGQTCVAPDYLLVVGGKEREEALLREFEKVYEEFYPGGDTRGSDSFARMIADRHFERVNGLLEKTKGKIVVGGETDKANKYIAPTIVKDVLEDDSLMSEELFGPVLPILLTPTLASACAFISARPRPLCVYQFSTNAANKEYVERHTMSGMISVNDLIIGGGVEGLPFGGSGPSGYGSHCDKAGFDAFTHRRASVDVPGWLDWILSFRYPPYTDKKVATMKKLLYKPIPYSRPNPSGTYLSTRSKSKLAYVGSLLKLLGLVGFLLALVAGVKK